MATKRQKKTIITGVTREEAEYALGVYAKAQAKAEEIVAKIEQLCTDIRSQYADALAAEQSEAEEAFNVLQSYATEHRAELFKTRRSLDMAHGTIGFRTGQPRLKTLRGFTWASALELVREFMPSYIRTTEEIAKDRLLADARCQEAPEQMERCGICMVQDETFYVTRKTEGHE